MPKKKEFKELELKDQERIRDIISQNLGDAIDNISKATGYYSSFVYSILADSVAKSFEINIDIALLVKPHYEDLVKVKHYLKVNPHNVLDEPIIAFHHNHWYEIYNGVHRTECARQLGKKTIKATLVTPSKEDLERRNLL